MDLHPSPSVFHKIFFCPRQINSTIFSIDRDQSPVKQKKLYHLLLDAHKNQMLPVYIRCNWTIYTQGSSVVTQSDLTDLTETGSERAEPLYLSQQPRDRVHTLHVKSGIQIIRDHKMCKWLCTTVYNTTHVAACILFSIAMYRTQSSCDGRVDAEMVPWTFLLLPKIKIS